MLDVAALTMAIEFGGSRLGKGLDFSGAGNIALVAKLIIN